MDRGGRIWVAAQAGDGHVRVSVRDRGRGIGKDILPVVFELFSQEPLDRDQSGAGIGLALARGLVELHGGRIEARSDGPGRGAELIVYLPLASEASGAPVEQACVASCITAPARRRVLVVDDHRDSADSLAMMLGNSGHQVRVAYDGEEAVATAEAWLPEVVLLDLGMPKLDGHDVCRFIRAQSWGRRMRIIAMTGWGQREDRRRTEAAGFEHHLVKPVEPAELERLLASPE
jgi:CheY-like chemotaxis protein